MPTIPDLSDLDAWRERSARNLAAQWEHIPSAMGLPCERWEDVWAADLGSPAPYPNSAALLRPLAEDGAPELVARLDAFYNSHPGGPWMLWSAWPTPDLRATGLRLLEEMPLMVRLPGALPPAPPELRIVEALDDVTLRAMDHVMIDGYPVHELRPEERLTDARALGGPMRFFVGYLGDEPVTCAASYTGEQEVGIYMVATMPQARGKGYGGAVTSAAVASAPDLPAILQASGDGQPVYTRLGFQVVTPYTIWYKPRAQAQS
ncbi:MAG TPA: GNAT family N-acetyltransferase [Ktedonobacterales bacterium]|jgi:ribosomal protein S18 acetylase RimI-like enzyme